MHAPTRSAAHADGRKLAVERGAVVQPELAPDKIERLDAVGALVDRGDADIAQDLRGARLFDVARAAVHLDVEGCDLIGDVGREGLGDRGQQGRASLRLGPALRPKPLVPGLDRAHAP